METIIYNILTYTIIAGAVFIAIRKMVSKTSPKTTDCSSGCGGCTSKCDLKEMVNTQKKNS